MSLNASHRDVCIHNGLMDEEDEQGYRGGEGAKEAEAKLDVSKRKKRRYQTRVIDRSFKCTTDPYL